ncbi:MAG: esterase family protein, partial [Candidatus Omnitrophica bacterium]|nr:esterase family protein [Candidatus Omnitrophota bacterium]
SRILIYLLLTVAVYLTILFSAVSPRMLFKAVSGPNAAEKKIQEFSIASPYQRTATKIRVLLPDNFRPDKRYPVLYVLPSVPQLMDPWWNSGMIEVVRLDVANRFDVICVAPTFSDMPWYADHPTDPGIRQESYFLKTVVPFVDENFPTIADGWGRYLLGYSKSGTGAFTLMLRYPDMFRRALSWDAPLKFDFAAVPGAELKKIYGTEENFLKYHIPALLEEKAPHLRGGPPRFVLMGYSDNKKAIDDDHRMFDHFGIPHIFDNTTASAHQWHSGWFHRAVEYLLAD